MRAVSTQDGHLFRRSRTPLALGLAIFLMGCGYTRQARDDVQPKAVPAMRLAQTLNPDAGKNHKVVAGLDSEVAKNVNTAYSKSFVSEKPRMNADDAFSGTKVQ